ncbi:ribonuclease HII [Thermosulfurimonas dismutans]|uniref:Ribonuclease HII n=1 Tax=Thermosulfurimonas dismutans TaxID=999894 RepID=A0A179D440_9BACT|nr:ribonuclease HII [Thermosulfurimonas dismutans]OAQ20827.1 Ribonuclease HII [Thermosulfurimonas dismutans]
MLWPPEYFSSQRWAREKSFRKAGYRFIAGVDEVGRGALAGPVVAAAVILPEDFDHEDLADSKVLTPEKRATLYEIIVREAISWAVGEASHEEVDALGILQASLLAMSRAVTRLTPTPELLLVDGRFCLPGWSGPQKAVVDGDALCASVAAASIVAKVTRDRLMESVSPTYPVYGFSRHKGYGTKEHLEALKLYGPCPIHRRTFRPVSDLTGPPGPR